MLANLIYTNLQVDKARYKKPEQSKSFVKLGQK